MYEDTEVVLEYKRENIYKIQFAQFSNSCIRSILTFLRYKDTEVVLAYNRENKNKIQYGPC